MEEAEKLSFFEILNFLKQAAMLKITVACTLQYFNIAACLFSTFNYITPDNFPANKKDRPRFPQTVVLHLLRLQSVI